MNENLMICTRCNESFNGEDLNEFEGEIFCNDCLDCLTTWCDNCGARFRRDNDMGDENISLCNICYNSHYDHCHDCRRLINLDDARYFEDDDRPFCSDCYYDREDEDSFDYINPYSYKPLPIFRGNGNLFYGVELEIDLGGLNDKNAGKIITIANRDGDNAYIKQDGSLDDGFEIVTHPMSLDYHRNVMPWQEILQKAVCMGYKSHQACTCGLHIHASKAGLGSTEEEQERSISNILYFVELFWSEMLQFSRRTEDAMNRWASRYGRKNSPKEQLEHAKKNNYSRYVCVNLANQHTIEFRLFRGTLKYETLIATLQLVDEICKVAITFSEFEMQNISWREFVLGIDATKKSELIQYLKLRQLFVNEPIIDESEEM